MPITLTVPPSHAISPSQFSHSHIPTLLLSPINPSHLKPTNDTTHRPASSTDQCHLLADITRRSAPPTNRLHTSSLLSSLSRNRIWLLSGRLDFGGCSDFVGGYSDLIAARFVGLLHFFCWVVGFSDSILCLWVFFSGVWFGFVGGFSFLIWVFGLLVVVFWVVGDAVVVFLVGVVFWIFGVGFDGYFLSGL